FDSSYNPITSLTFDASHPWNVAQTVYVEAINGNVVRGFRQVDLVLTMTSSLASGSEYAGQSQTLTVDVADNNAPGVRGLESNGSTDMIEGGGTDTYKVVLTKAPAAGETVTVNAVSEPAWTNRGGGANGLRSYDKKVLLSTDGINFSTTIALTFNAGNWNV